MSAPVAGKFQDHYAVLGIDPKADSETIQDAYNKLAQKYHPNNRDTGNADKFAAANLAFEVLSDPSLRMTFDQIKGIDHDGGAPKFTGVGFFHALEQGSVLRSAVLCILYDRRRTKSFKPSLSMRHIEGMLQVTPEELNFAIWYLKQRALVVNDDKSSLEITVAGMDFLEQNLPTAGAVMPMIKESAVAGAQPSEHPSPAAHVAEHPSSAPHVEKGEEKSSEKAPETVLNVLNRAMKRSPVSEEAGR